MQSRREDPQGAADASGGAPEAGLGRAVLHVQGREQRSAMRRPTLNFVNVVKVIKEALINF